MWRHKSSQLFVNNSRTVRPVRQQAQRRRGGRLRLEQLEDRLTPSNFSAATVSDLIADINAANLTGGSNTIALVAGNTFTLTGVDNTADGATGLPVIAANDNLTILGNGDTIQRSTASGTPAFRLFDVTSGAALTLENLTLQGGLEWGSSQKSAEGGAIYSYGTLVLNGVTVQNNMARGSNLAAYGGGLFVGGGTATLTSTTVNGNQASGGTGTGLFHVPLGFGGGMYVAGGTVTLTSDTVEFNSANADGGGLFIRSGTVCLDAYTVQHVINNTAPSHPNIYGSYTICP